jgi:uncharacterized protein (UPF0332 family)
MTFRPDQYHEVAKRLSENILPLGEGRYRTIAGRAYYAAYLATRESLRQVHGFGNDYDPGHENVSNTLASVSGDPQVSKLGNLLNTLRLKRLRADYKLTVHVMESEAEDSVVEAGQVLALLPAVRDRLPRITPPLR